MATPWSKVAMANQFGGVKYSEISKVAMAPPWSAIAESCHGHTMASHCRKMSYILFRNLQSRHGMAMATLEISIHSMACHGGALTSHGRHGYIVVSMASHGQPWLRFGQNQEYWIFMGGGGVEEEIRKVQLWNE